MHRRFLRALIGLGFPIAFACGAPAPPIDAPEPGGGAREPIPSCQVVVNEFIWRLELHNLDEVRDGLVGECVDVTWSGEERRCVADAVGGEGLAECGIETSVTLVVGSQGDAAEVGIEECDGFIAEFRRCASETLPTQELADTEEALDETVALWREMIGEPGGVRKVHTLCHQLAETERAHMKRNGCEIE